MASFPIKICAMATNDNDQSSVRDLASLWPDKVVPCFGYHPWFSHWISLNPAVSKEQHYKELLLDVSRTQTDEMNEAFEELLPNLPQPILLSDCLDTLRSNLTDFPRAMLGEVGLDRAFKIPFLQNPGNGRRKLSNFTVPLEHQMHVLESQLQLAVELRRNVSMHSVKASQITLQLVDRMSKMHGEAWDMISVDMHSCSMNPEMWMALEKNHPNVYMSLSTAINGRSQSHKELIAACGPDRILAESDFHDVRESPERTWEMCNIIADVKGWHVEDHWNPSITEDDRGVIQRLEENWKTFLRGDHVMARRELESRKLTRKIRKGVTAWDFEESDT